MHFADTILNTLTKVVPGNVWYFLLLLLVLPLPIETDLPIKRIPWVTYSLIAINIVVYGITSPNARLDQGSAIFATWGVHSHATSPITFVTYAFLHVSPEHLFWNMVYLWLFGPHVEIALGKAAYVALYIGGGIAAALLHISILTLMPQDSALQVAPLVGASGAISAILAPYALRFYRSQIRFIWLPALLFLRAYSRFEMAAITAIGLWLAENVIMAGMSFYRTATVAYWAHLGGFVFGLVAAQLANLFNEGREDYAQQDAAAKLLNDGNSSAM